MNVNPEKLANPESQQKGLNPEKYNKTQKSNLNLAT